MNDNNYARGLHVLLYFIMIILNIVLGHFSRPWEDYAFIAILIIYYVITLVILTYFGSRRRTSLGQHMMLSGILMLISAWGAGMNTGNLPVYYVMSYVPLITLMTYMEQKYYGRFLIIYYIQLILSFFVPLKFNEVVGDNILKVTYFLIAVIFGILMYYFLKMMLFRDRYLAEQEQSVNDLQKVIMAKCVEAKAATKSKSDFLSNMSHEIRTPLNAILGMNEMILRENRDDTIAKYAGNVDRSGQMLLSLINDVLDFSKIESGKLELVMSEYQIFMVIKDIITMLDGRFKKKELKLITNISSDIPKVLLGDDVRIKQIMTNIITNAVKYTAEGSVEISVQAQALSDDAKTLLIISVKDTGQGMSEENLKKLFDSFSRFNQKENRQIEGTGLGMAITKSLIDAMKGTIEVYSELGKGSEFVVKIPQKIVDATPSGDFDAYSSKELSAKKRDESKFIRPDASALIVDDSRVNLAVAKGLLKYSKMKVTTASSGAECLKLVSENKYDIILLDHMMPQMDGIETLKHIKDEHMCDDTPIVALTANAVGNAKEMYLSNGFDDYLSKPISGDGLEDIMRKWLKPVTLGEDDVHK